MSALKRKKIDLIFSLEISKRLKKIFDLKHQLATFEYLTIGWLKFKPLWS